MRPERRAVRAAVTVAMLAALVADLVASPVAAVQYIPQNGTYSPQHSQPSANAYATCQAAASRQSGYNGGNGQTGPGALEGAAVLVP